MNNGSAFASLDESWINSSNNTASKPLSRNLWKQRSLEDVAGDRPLRGRLPGGPVLASAAGATGRSGTVQVSIRPADIRILPGETPPEPGHNTLAGTVRSQVLTGSILDIFVTLEDAAGTTVRVQSLPPAPAAPGTRVTLAVDPARTVTLED